MGGSSFDTIAHSFELLAQEVQKQQQLMEQLEEENQELRRQLTGLREGRGIFLMIEGTRFPLIGDSIPSIPRAVPAPAITQQLPDLIEIQEEQEPRPEEFDIADAPTTAIAESDINPLPSIPETPVVASIVPFPNTEDDMEVVFEEEEQVAQIGAPTPNFLEEMLLDEFAEAATSPLAVWTPPATKQEQALSSDEEKKAVLRKELAGSYMLE